MTDKANEKQIFHHDNINFNGIINERDEIEVEVEEATTTNEEAIKKRNS